MLFGQRVVDLNTFWGDMRVLGDDADDWSGFSVAYGDINGDGYMDIIIGTPFADPGGRSDAGETYVIFGSSFPNYVVDLNTQTADITVYGGDDYDNSGMAVASGDVNGDGYDDIIIGAPYADPPGGNDAGETYVIFGSSSPPSTVDLRSELADITVYGAAADDESGSAVASGDVNNDGCDDILIGAPLADPGAPERSSAGETYVVFGDDFTPPVVIDLNDVPSPADMSIYGAAADDESGSAVASGDVNNDGCDDILIGAHYADPGTPARSDAGETYIIFGSSSPPSTIDLSTESSDITVYGDDAEGRCGWAIASGNINNDGCDDIIIGAYGASPGGRTNAGQTCVIFGSMSPPSTIDLSIQSADITIYGDDAGDLAGYAVASGDVNADGYDDLIIGAHHADPPGGDSAGETYVIFGSSSPSQTIDLSSQSADITIYGDDAGDLAGSAVAGGDVDGDGYDDIIIGARYADPPGSGNAGETYVIFGGGPITVAHGEGGDSWVAVWDSITNKKIFNRKVFGGGNTNGEVHIARGDVDGDGEEELICGHGYGGCSWVSVYKLNGTRIFNRKVFGGGNINGEVHVGAGDVDGDGVDELICGHGRGGGSWVSVYELNGTRVFNRRVFGDGNTQGEVHVAGGDVNGDGVYEIICGQGRGGASWVNVYWLDGTRIFSRKVFWDGNTQGEVNVGAGDVDGDGDDDIICGHGYGGCSWVSVCNLHGIKIFDKKVFQGDNTNGEVHVAGGNIGLDRTDEILCGHGFGGSSWVKVYELDGTLLYDKKVFGGGNSNGEVHVGSENKITSPRLDYSKPKEIISGLVINFFQTFEKLMYLDADYIVKDFTPSCRGRKHQRDTILLHQASWQEDPFILKIYYLSSVEIEYITENWASGISITNRIVSTRIRDGHIDETVCTHIYTALVEHYRWWLCDYVVNYESGSRELFSKLFPKGLQ